LLYLRIFWLPWVSFDMLRHMSIGHIQEKIKEMLRFCEKRDIYTPFIIILVAVSSFSLGKTYHNVLSEPPVILSAVDMPKRTISIPVSGENETGRYVASKTGKKYHLLSCASAKSISEANRIWFDTKEAAEKAGYTPASNCKGI